MSEKVLINKSRLIELLQMEDRFSRLVCGGVDNWEGYSDSIKGKIIDFPTIAEATKTIVEMVNCLSSGDVFEG